MDNAISGQMKQKGSALYDPMSNNAICINGQMMLLDLVEHIEPYSATIRLIQNNTDGLIYELLDYENDFDILDGIEDGFRHILRGNLPKGCEQLSDC